jgi:hypothetical protein
MHITWGKNIHTTKLDTHRRQNVLISKLEQLHNQQFKIIFQLRIRSYTTTLTDVVSLA